MLKGLYRKGKELFGKLCFTRPAWELVKSANARRLSVAIRKDKTGIAEVSLVREPRIADAAVFSEIDVLLFDGAELAAVDMASPELKLEVETEHLIDRFKREGKLVPASETFARAILRTPNDSVITFGNDQTPIAKVFQWFLEAQPKVIEFGELAPAQPNPFDEPELFRKLGITTETVERYRAR